MIRVLHVVTYMGRGGLETTIMNYYRHINRQEIQFDFLVHREFEADYDKEIEKLGGKIFHLPRLVPWSKSYNKALSDFFKLHPQYKIVHVHQDCLSSVALRVAKNSGVPIRIAHSHNSSQNKDIKYPIKLFYKSKITKHATHLMACGKKAGDWMFNGADYLILNNSIDSSKYTFNSIKRTEVRANFNLPQDALIVGHIGRFLAVKNHAFVLEIFSEIKKKNPNSFLVLVGDGPLRPAIENQIKELGLSENVLLTGIRSDVNEILQAIDVYIMPSLYEGLPVALVEAQASGLPCLICDHFSPDCDITHLTERLSLNDSAEKWANTALSLKNIQRTDTSDIIKNAGYDVTQNAKWLQEYYINLWKEIQ